MIFLIRHFEKDSKPYDKLIESYFQYTLNRPLSELGVEHAKKAAYYLKHHNSIVVSSNFKRSLQTANVLTEKNILTDERLGERVLCDERHSNLFKEYNERSLSDWNWSAPGGESMESVADRMKQAIDEFSSIYSDKNLVIVSHSRSLQAFLGLYCEGLEAYKNSNVSLIVKYGEIITIEPADNRYRFNGLRAI